MVLTVSFLSLNNINDTRVRPACVAQVSRKRSSGGACCWVLKHASRCKRVADVEQLRIFCRYERDRDQACSFHQLSAALEVIVHASKRIALFQSQDDMVSTAVNLRGRNFHVEIVDRVVEKLQQMRL